MKLTVIIPCFNEVQTVGHVIKAIYDTHLPFETQIIVVDDGSTDGSRELLSALEKSGDVLLLQNENNLGKGASIRNGLVYATGDYIIIQDADLEYCPSDYIKLLKAVSGGHPTVIFGTRMLQPWKGYFLSLIFNKVISRLLSRVIGLPITDALTGLKLFPAASVLPHQLDETHFGFDVELTLLLAPVSNHYREVPIKYRPRTYKEGKKINWRDGWEILMLVLRAYAGSGQVRRDSL